MKLLSFLSPREFVHSGSVYNREITVVQMYGKNVLLVNGIQQTGPYTQKLWNIGLRPTFAAASPVSNILVFGVGGGTVFHQFGKVFPNANMVGVDIDPEIIKIGKKYFGLDTLAHLSLRSQDARAFAARARNAKKYDLVLIDLYAGNDVPAFVTQKPFLSEVWRLLRPDGRMVMNYFDQKNQAQSAQALYRRLQAIYQTVEMQNVLRNMFFYVLK